MAQDAAAADILRTVRQDAVVTLCLNRPRAKNALSPPLLEALLTALREASADPSVRVVVLTGEGGAFCAGADLKEAMGGDGELIPRVEKAIDGYHAIIRAIVGAPKPVIAMIDGPAVGFGCDLALACDLRVASTTAYLQEKFVRIGLMPDGGGTFWLPRLVGLARAMEIMLTGEPITAQRALELGIVNRVTTPETLREESMRLAHELAKGPPLAFAEIKRAMLGPSTQGIDTALEAEKQGQTKCLRSEDCLEGVMAWMQKREPVFRGR
jgi:enoyl-CoA hydratase/carnithine racemase